MELRQIRYALAVAKEHSFTKAANRLNISQSAVSEQVKLLEEEAGFPLFARAPGGIEVTERPGAQLEIVTAPTSRIFDDLHEERIDAGLAIESDPDRVPAGLVFERLTSVEMVLIAHPKHALMRAHRAVDIGRLVREPIVMSELSVG